MTSVTRLGRVHFSTTNLQLTQTGNLVTQPTAAWLEVQFTNVVNLIDRRKIYP